MENFELYADHTSKRDWKSICATNGIQMDSFGTKKELGVLADHLNAGEVVFALTSGIMSKMDSSNSSDMGMNTWLVVLTNERFLFLDCALLTRSVDTQSIRHDRVQAVSASQGWVLGKIMIDIGSRTIIVDNCQKATVSVIADLANKWLRQSSAPPSTPSVAATNTESGPSNSALDKLERLASLFASGALSAEEFATAKSKLLSAL